MRPQKKMFVAMPFQDEFRDVFDLGIKVAAEELEYLPLKVEDIKGPIAIHATIVEEIYTSDVIVADVSFPNPNVYYELGGSHAIFRHNKTIMIAREGTSIPFDLKVYQVIFYRHDARGIHNLAQELIQQIKFIEEIPAKSKNPWVDFRPLQYNDGLGITVFASEREEPRLRTDLLKAPLRRVRIFGKNLIKLFKNERHTFGQALKQNPGCTVEFQIPGGSQEFKQNFLQFLGSLERHFSFAELDQFYNSVVGSYLSLKEFLDSPEYRVGNRTTLSFTPFLPMLSLCFYDFVYDKGSYVRVKHLLPTALDTLDTPRLTVYRCDADMYQTYERIWDELKKKATIYTGEQPW